MERMWFILWLAYCILTGAGLVSLGIDITKTPIKFISIDGVLLILGFTIFFIASKLSLK